MSTSRFACTSRRVGVDGDRRRSAAGSLIGGEGNELERALGPARDEDLSWYDRPGADDVAGDLRVGALRATFALFVCDSWSRFSISGTIYASYGSEVGTRPMTAADDEAARSTATRRCPLLAELEKRPSCDVASGCCSGLHPDLSSIARFRARHLVGASRSCSCEAARLCAETGMVRSDAVALDGTKVGANASLRKAMSYERMSGSRSEARSESAEIDGLLADAR